MSWQCYSDTVWFYFTHGVWDVFCSDVYVVKETVILKKLKSIKDNSMLICEIYWWVGLCESLVYVVCWKKKRNETDVMVDQQLYHYAICICLYLYSIWMDTRIVNLFKKENLSCLTV